MVKRSKINLLYAEDDASVVAFIKVLLKKYDYIQTQFASNGQEALEAYKNSQFGYDIVITDMMMPIMDGFELIEEVKKINPSQIVIMATGMEERNDLIRAIELRVNFFLNKPLKPAKFHTILEESISSVYKEREHKLSVSILEQYKHAIDSNTIVSKSNSKGVITYVNDKFCEMSGYTREELIGKPHSILRDPEMDSSIFYDMWHTIKDLKTTWNGEIRNRAKDGSFYWVQATISPILNAENEILEFIAIRTDITQQHKIQEYFQGQLKISAQQFDSALNLTKQYELCIDQSNAIIRTDQENIITYVNDKFCNASGYTSEELIGLNCSEIRDQSHRNNGDCKAMQNKLQEKQLVSIVFKNIAKDGTTFYMDTLVYPIVDNEGNTIEHLQLMHNITEIIELNQEIEDTQKEVVFTMGAIGETRSKETGNHVKRVAEYSYLLAKLVGLSEEESELIKMASPMHDIGKVGIPDSILNKPGRLDKDEFEIMKEHSTIGYEMLKGSNRSILKASSLIAYEHHERWDGKGYPNQKAGEDIHIYGRITAICDVFDALGSDRCYKKAWDLEKILKLFHVERGQQFDPNLMDLFLDNLDQFLAIRDKYVD